MEELLNYLKELVGLMGFEDYSVSYDDIAGRYLVFINDDYKIKTNLPNFVSALDYVFRAKAAQHGEFKLVLVDVNNYRKERENIIIEIAKGAARKAATTKEEVSLPAMNGYERRIIHMELASRPDVCTESIGEGKERYVIVRPIE